MTQSSRSRELLFVNKNSSSSILSRSYEAEERFTIFSHVQNRRWRGKRRKRMPIDNRNALDTTNTSQSPLDSSHNKEIHIKGRNYLQASWVSETTSSRQYLLQVYPDNNTSDPFHCTVAGIDAGNHLMLRYVFASFAKVTLLAEAFALPSIYPNTRSARHGPIMDQRLNRCVEDEMLMYATLAYGSSSLAFYTGRIDSNKPPEYFIDKALQALRLHLSKTGLDKPPDVWLLITVEALAVVEFWASIPEMWTRCPSRYLNILRSDRSHGLKAPRTHLKALNHAVQKVGGWTNIHPYVLEISVLVDKHMAIYDMTPPIIPLIWDPGCMPEIRRNELGINTNGVLTNLGKNLIGILTCQNLSLILEDLIDFCKTAHCAWSCSEILTGLDENWLFLRQQAHAYRLLSLGDSLSTIDHCVKIATIQFLVNATTYHNVYSPSQTLLRALISALIDAQFWNKEFNRDLLFWCLCTGAMSTGSSDERDWFQAMLIRFFKAERSPWTLQAFCLNLEPFLFLPTKQEKQLNEFVQRLTAGEDFVLSESHEDKFNG